jgi:hypothetical protein
MNKKRFSVKLLLFVLTAVIAGSCKKEFPKPPVADAGSVKFIQLPGTVTLTGTGQTTNHAIVGYLWSLISGPNVPLIQSPSSATTVVSNLVAGNYKFQFQVIDDAGLSGLDTVSVVASTAPVQTITIQPANNPLEMTIGNVSPTSPGSNGGYFPIAAWTTGGNPVSIRSLIKFDISAIPANATIVSAKLSLYAHLNPNNGNLVDAHFGTTNAVSLQRITSAWSSTTSWNTQPTATTVNQATIPQSTSAFQNDTDIDVTALITDIKANTNYGILAKLTNEQYYNSRQYYSSFATDAAKRPKLVITYQ